jgi:hypothetical protein
VGWLSIAVHHLSWLLFAKLLLSGIVNSAMTTKSVLPAALIVIIAILGGLLTYEIIQRRQDQRGSKQFAIALGVKLYQGLESGDVEAVKRRIGGFVAANALLYEQEYGHETGKKFANVLSEAADIRASFQAPSK